MAVQLSECHLEHPLLEVGLPVIDRAEPLLQAEIMMSSSMTLSLILRSQLSDLNHFTAREKWHILSASRLHNEDILISHRCLCVGLAVFCGLGLLSAY